MTAAEIRIAFCWFCAASGRRPTAETADQGVVSGVSGVTLPTGGQILRSLASSCLLLAGCGGSSSANGNAEKQITVPAYNGYPAITVPVTSGTPAQCRREAQVFSRAAVSFLAPFPSDSDTHLVLARLQFLEFKAHRCDIAILRKALSRRATANQRRAIVARVEFAFLGDAGRELTAS